MEPADDTDAVFNDRWAKREELLMRLELSQNYHRKRERFYDFWDRAIKATALIGGSAAASRLLSADGLTAVGATVTATSALSLVYNLSERSRRHSELASEFGRCAAALVSHGRTTFQEEHLTECEAKVLQLEATEPAALYTLVVMCQNELAIARGQPEKVHAVPLWKRWTASWFSWGPRTQVVPTTSPA